MSVQKMILGASVILALTTVANDGAAKPFTAEDPAYTEAVKDFGKQMLSALYTSKQCADYGVSFNDEYFFYGPPVLWERSRWDSVIGKAMVETKNSLDLKHLGTGHEKFCKDMVEFYSAQIETGKKAVIIDMKKFKEHQEGP